jgi:DNA-binding PadR family transcriptional regulator
MARTQLFTEGTNQFENKSELYSEARQGLIQSREEIVEGRRRRVYSLTSAGRRSLTEQRDLWDAFQRAVNRVLKAGLEPA